MLPSPSELAKKDNIRIHDLADKVYAVPPPRLLACGIAKGRGRKPISEQKEAQVESAESGRSEIEEDSYDSAFEADEGSETSESQSIHGDNSEGRALDEETDTSNPEEIVLETDAKKCIAQLEEALDSHNFQNELLSESSIEMSRYLKCCRTINSFAASSPSNAKAVTVAGAIETISLSLEKCLEVSRGNHADESNRDQLRVPTVVFLKCLGSILEHASGSSERFQQYSGLDLLHSLAIEVGDYHEFCLVASSVVSRSPNRMQPSLLNIPFTSGA